MNRRIKKTVSILLCVLLAFGAAGLSASAGQNTRKTVSYHEASGGASAVYLGKATYKGSTVRYIWSADFSRTADSLKALEDLLLHMEDTAWAELIAPLKEAEDGTGIRVCSDAEKTDEMDETWVSAEAAGLKCWSNVRASSKSTQNLYDADETAAEYMDRLFAERAATVEDPLPVNKSYISYKNSASVSDIYYTIEDGDVVRHEDEIITYQCEEVTVYVTAASFAEKQKEIVNLVGENGKITKTSSVYLGEVFVDGESRLTYVYSADLDNRAEAGLGKLYAALSGAQNTAFAALLDEEAYTALSDAETPGEGLKLCSEAGYAAEMDERWTTAAAAAQAYFGELTAEEQGSRIMQEADAGFKAASDAQAAQLGFAPNDENNAPVDTENRLIGILSEFNTDTVTYTVIDGVLVKIVDRIVTYHCELVTVYYTCVSLTTRQTPGDVDGKDGVTAADARLALRCAVGLEAYEEGSREYLACDVDMNGQVTAADARLILRKAVGFEDPEFGKKA